MGGLGLSETRLRSVATAGLVAVAVVLAEAGVTTERARELACSGDASAFRLIITVLFPVVTGGGTTLSSVILSNAGRNVFQE